MARNSPELTADITLVGQGVDPKTVRRAIAVRAIALVLSKPDEPMSAENVAKRLDCDPVEVLHVLRSPEYAEMIRTDLLNWSLSGLARSQPALQKIVDSEHSKPMEKIAAVRAMATVYETATRVGPAHVSGKARVKFEGLLDTLRKIRLSETEPKEIKSD